MYPGSELTFVNVQNPNDEVDPTLRHRIRSRAAFHTHECRLKTTLPLQLSQSLGQYNVLVPGYTLRKEGSRSKQFSLGRKRLRSASTVEQDEIDAAVRREALKNRLSTTCANAPVPYERWHAHVLNVWNNDTFAKYWKVTNIEQMTDVNYHDYQSWMQQASTTDPTLYYSELLSGITGAYPNEGQGKRLRLFVEAELCREINRALDDPYRRLSTMTLVSVARLALYEFSLGNRETALRIHFPGLKRMLEMKGGEQELRKDAPRMVVEVLRVHAWTIVELCELNNEQPLPFSGTFTEPAHRVDKTEGSSDATVVPFAKQEEPGAEASHSSYSHDLHEAQVSPAVNDRPDGFFRQITWQPFEAKLQRPSQPCEKGLLSFWTTADTVRDYPPDFVTARRLDALSQSADSIGPEIQV